MNPPDLEHFREVLRTRSLSIEEQRQLDAWFLARPEQAGDWEAEVALQQSFHQMPGLEPSSNFNARVIDALRLSIQSPRPVRPWWWRLSSFLKPALALVAISALVVSWNQSISPNQRLDAKVLATLAELEVPSTDVLLDFEVIREYQGGLIQPDTDLLFALQ